MTPLELAASAAQAMAEPGTVGVVLTVPKGGLPRTFPRGELLNEMERNGVVERTYHFDPQKVIAWLVSNGLIEMTRTGDGIFPDYRRVMIADEDRPTAEVSR